MAMTSCPECIRPVSDQADRCPHCGFKPSRVRRGPGLSRGMVALVAALVAVIVGQSITIVVLVTRADESSSLVTAATLDIVAKNIESRGAMGELEEIKKLACACRDAECANEVQEKFNHFLEKYKDTKGSASEAEMVGKLASQMSECLMRAATGGEGGF